MIYQFNQAFVTSEFNICNWVLNFEKIWMAQFSTKFNLKGVQMVT